MQVNFPLETPFLVVYFLLCSGKYGDTYGSEWANSTFKIAAEMTMVNIKSTSFKTHSSITFLSQPNWKNSTKVLSPINLKRVEISWDN